MPVVWLIRHGESRSNAGLPTSCPETVALTDSGIGQAELVARLLASGDPPDLIVTSLYQRTKQTSVPAKLRFLLADEQVWPVHEFTYLSEEEFRGPSSIEDRKPLKDMYWEICDPKLVDGPGSESFEQFIGRVQDVINMLRQTSYQTIAIFSHEQFIRALQWVTEGKLIRASVDTMRAFKAHLIADPLPNAATLRANVEHEQECWEWQFIDEHLLIDEHLMAPV